MLEKICIELCTILVKDMFMQRAAPREARTTILEALQVNALWVLLIPQICTVQKCLYGLCDRLDLADFNLKQLPQEH